MDPYKSLTDPHLACYYSNNRIKTQLKNAGLITPTGTVVTDNAYQLRIAQLENKDRKIDMVKTSVKQSFLEEELRCKIAIANKCEEIRKLKKVHQIKEEEKRGKATMILPELKLKLHDDKQAELKLKLQEDKQAAKYLTPTFNSNQRCKSAIATTTMVRSKSCSTVKKKDSDATNFLTNGNSVSRATLERLYPPIKLNLTFQSEDIPWQTNFIDNNFGARKIASACIHDVPYASILRHSNPPQMKNKHRRLEMHKITQCNQRFDRKEDGCIITLRYEGLTAASTCNDSYHSDDILVEQNMYFNTIVRFKGPVQPHENFNFVSRRATDCTWFSMLIYINGRADTRLSTCCEGRYKVGHRLGGREGHFTLVGVKNPRHCTRCELANEKSATKKKKKKKGLKSKEKTEIEDEKKSEKGDLNSNESELKEKNKKLEEKLNKYKEKLQKLSDERMRDCNLKMTINGVAVGRFEPSRRRSMLDKYMVSIDDADINSESCARNKRKKCLGTNNSSSRSSLSSAQALTRKSNKVSNYKKTADSTNHSNISSKNLRKLKFYCVPMFDKEARESAEDECMSDNARQDNLDSSSESSDYSSTEDTDVTEEDERKDKSHIAEGKKIDNIPQKNNPEIEHIANKIDNYDVGSLSESSEGSSTEFTDEAAEDEYKDKSDCAEWKKIDIIPKQNDLEIEQIVNENDKNYDLSDSSDSSDNTSTDSSQDECCISMNNGATNSRDILEDEKENTGMRNNSKSEASNESSHSILYEDSGIKDTLIKKSLKLKDEANNPSFKQHNAEKGKKKGKNKAVNISSRNAENLAEVLKYDKNKKPVYQHFSSSSVESRNSKIISEKNETKYVMDDDRYDEQAMRYKKKIEMKKKSDNESSDIDERGLTDQQEKDLSEKEENSMSDKKQNSLQDNEEKDLSDTERKSLSDKEEKDLSDKERKDLSDKEENDLSDKERKGLPDKEEMDLSDKESKGLSD